MTRREHIEKLAAEIGATIQYDASRYRMAADTVNRVLHLAPWPGMEPSDPSLGALLSGAYAPDAPPVPEEETYWVALHEMGHLETTPVPGPLRVESVVEYEARAWAWALTATHFPLDQAAQSSIAWGLADYIHGHGLKEKVATDAMRELVDALGPDPDWFQNVVTPEHWHKLETWGRTSWAKLVALVAA